MNTNNKDRIFLLLTLVIIALFILCLVLGATLGILKLTSRGTADGGESDDTSDSDTAVSVDPQAVMLDATADAGMAYIDRMIFFGESTTAHLRARGVLSDGKDTKQVWADASGTKRLSSKLTSETVVYPPTGESLTISQACALEKPDYIVLSFGLNGLSDFIANKSAYVNNYGKLIQAIQSASPDTKVILQTVYPVCQAGNFAEDVETLNQYIMKLNEWLPEIAAAYENVRVADTASVLRSDANALISAYDNGDGQHLTADAYLEILSYLRTHAWQ